MGLRAKRRTYNEFHVKNSPTFLQGRKGKENEVMNFSRKNEDRAEINCDNRTELPFNLTINAPPKTNHHPNTGSHVFKGASTNSCRLKTHSMNATSPSSTYFLLRRPSKPTPKLKLTDFQMGVCKGSGRFGKVFQAIHLQTGLLVAIKQISKTLLKPILPQFVNELRIHLLMAHPNLVKLFGFFDDAEHVFLLMEYMEEGSVYSKLMRKGKLGES
jgi:hypothetical protein